MDGHTFDNLLRRFSRGEIGRRQFLAGSLALAVGATRATRLASAQEAAPSPAASSIQGQTGATSQQFPCPGPDDPFDWICGNGPFSPWYPVIAPPEITAATGIRWYGFQRLEDGSLMAEAFDREGMSVSHYESARADGGLRWAVTGTGTKIDGHLKVPDIVGPAVALSGEINGSPFRVTIEQDGAMIPEPDQAIELDANQQRLLEQWQPAIERMDAMMRLAAQPGDDPVSASDFGCFMAGAIAVPSVALCAVNPAGCVIAGGAGGYIVKNCSEW